MVWLTTPMAIFFFSFVLAGGRGRASRLARLDGDDVSIKVRRSVRSARWYDDLHGTALLAGLPQHRVDTDAHRTPDLAVEGVR